MDHENEHIKKLAAARSKAVIERRNVAKALTEDYRRGEIENTRSMFIALQSMIEAIDRAIADEKHIEIGENQGTPPGGI